jgi:hypothetical protein
MSLRNPEIGFENGIGRMMGPGDVPKVQQMGQQQSYATAVDVLRASELVFRMNEKTHTKPPHSFEKQFWYPLAGEPAVKLRGNISDEVFTGLNGLDKEAWEAYPDDPEMARLIVRSKIQFVGIVDQNARTDIDFPRVTLKFAGTVPQYAPGAYNTPGREGAEIQFADKVIYDVPHLEKPIIAGFPGKIGKIVLVPCPATKESITARILHTTAHIIHDPAKYKRAMDRAEHIANANMHTAVALKNAALINGLMMVDLLLKEGVLVLTEKGQELDPNFTNDSTDITARLAEALSLLHPGEHNVAQPGAFSASLTAAQLQKWNKLEFDLGQRLFPLKNPETGKMNARNEFGMRVGPLNQPVSTGRSLESGEVLRSPIGRLLEKSLTALPLMVQSLVVAIDEENRLKAGWAASTPNQAGTGLFTLSLVPEGGNSVKRV